MEHDRTALLDTLQCVIGSVVYRQMVMLCKDVDFRMELVQMTLEMLLEKDIGHFKAATEQVVNEEKKLLIQRAIAAHHMVVNKTANNVPVVTADEFMLRLYKNVVREMLENIDILCFRSIKCVKFVRKMVRMNVRRAVFESVPIVEASSTSTVIVPTAEHQQIDADINQLIQPSKDIQLAPPAPLPITPQPAAKSLSPTSTKSPKSPKVTTQQSAGKPDVKDIFAQQSAHDSSEVKEFKNYD